MSATAFTAEFVERQYNNRALVPEHAGYFARWERDSQFVRESLPCTLDIAYGPDPRQRLDIFTVPGAIGTLVFIHGGYWRSLDRGMFSWLAAAWIAARVSVVMPSYRFCPAVRIDAIVDDAIEATNWVFESGPAHGLATGKVVLGGHSAGGHLVAAVFAAPRERLRFDTARIVGGVPVSGIFDFAPLQHFSFNSDFLLDDEAVRRLRLLDRTPTIAAPLLVAAGAAESDEFQRQSRELAAAWPRTRLLMLPSLNHFTVVDAFAERGQSLYESTLALF